MICSPNAPQTYEWFYTLGCTTTCQRFAFLNESLLLEWLLATDLFFIKENIEYVVA